MESHSGSRALGFAGCYGNRIHHANSKLGIPGGRVLGECHSITEHK